MATRYTTASQSFAAYYKYDGGRCLRGSVTAIMSNHYLPPEMLDHIVGFLRYNTPKLKECCLLSKSWIPRTRKYLFACIRLDLKGNLELWKKAFPDPAESPARYARILLIGALRDKEERRYIEAFSLIEELHVFPGLACSPSGSTAVERAFSLIPFDNFTTSLKTIVVIVIPIPSLEIINIILRLPLPENLTLHCGNFSYNHYNFYDEDSDDKPDGLPTLSHESTTALTGTLNLNSCHSVSLALCHILNMPRGLRFRGLRLSRLIALDLALVTELVMACSDTLEHLDFTGEINDDGTFRSDPSVDRLLRISSRCTQPD